MVMVEAGESEHSGLLKTRNLLIFRDAQNAEIGEIAFNWNVSGTRSFDQSSQFLVRTCSEDSTHFAGKSLIRLGETNSELPTVHPLNDWKGSTQIPSFRRTGTCLHT